MWLKCLKFSSSNFEVSNLDRKYRLDMNETKINFIENAADINLDNI